VLLGSVMVVISSYATGYAEKTCLHSLSFVDMNRTLSETALNTRCLAAHGELCVAFMQVV
jgi:hypothetical protein